MGKVATMGAVRKAKELRDYFDSKGKIHIVVDATRDDVQVPPHLKGDPGLCLLLNVRMPQRIDISKEGVDSVFSFSGNPFPCHVPMEAIWAAYQPQMSLEQGLIWQEDIPAQVQRVMAAMMMQGEPDAEPEEEAPPQREEAAGAKPAKGKRSKGHLRIV